MNSLQLLRGGGGGGGWRWHSAPAPAQLNSSTPRKSRRRNGAGSLRCPMIFSLETLAALATVIGTVVAVLALVQSSAWLVLISSAIACLSLGTVFYARAARRKLDAASTSSKVTASTLSTSPTCGGGSTEPSLFRTRTTRRVSQARILKSPGNTAAFARPTAYRRWNSVLIPRARPN